VDGVMVPVLLGTFTPFPDVVPPRAPAALEHPVARAASTSWREPTTARAWRLPGAMLGAAGQGYALQQRGNRKSDCGRPVP